MHTSGFRRLVGSMKVTFQKKLTPKLLKISHDLAVGEIREAFA